MSSGYASIETQLLRQNRTFDLELHGGSPLRETIIHDQDVRTSRKGWRYIVKLLGRPIVSKLKIEVRPMEKLSRELVVRSAVYMF